MAERMGKKPAVAGKPSWRIEAGWNEKDWDAFFQDIDAATGRLDAADVLQLIYYLLKPPPLAVRPV